MGTEFDKERYYNVIEACALKKDIDLFKFGDETVVGDRGITLSGGQKARVSLARAIYANRDLVILDDPLSAVDAEVSDHLFNNCIKGFLSDKTVILATHQIHIMSQADKILVLDKGHQIFFGSYSELQQREEITHIVGKLINKEEKTDDLKIAAKEDNTEKVQTAKDKLSIQEEERADGSVGLKIYYRFLHYGFKSCLVFPLILIILILAQGFYVAIV